MFELTEFGLIIFSCILHSLYYFMRAAQADDIDTHDNNSLENRGSEHVSDMPISRSEVRGSELSSGKSHDNW